MVALRRPVLIAGTALGLSIAPVAPSVAQQEIPGVPALAGGSVRAAGMMSVHETGPLARELKVTMSDAATGARLVEFEEELTQELHVIVVDDAFSTFIHEHAKEAAPDGSFQVAVQFPKPGTYHVYTDAVPAGLGQQVLRFDVPVGESAAAAPASLAAEPAKILRSTDGPYAVELDTSGLQAGRAGEVRLRILKDGRLADDLAPYLGVPAHAVFVATEDLAYLHAHADASTPDPIHASAGHGGHDQHAGHGTSSSLQSVPAEMTLHVTPPRPGIYAAWVQFEGGGEVRTVPFTIAVP